jgi:CheY-like chemotaxis protein
MNERIVRRILIIDDSLDQQVLLRMCLEASGYEIQCTSNGEEALTLLNSGTILPNMILLDMRMPVLDGAGFRLRQAEDCRLKDIPVVIMSGDAGENQLILGFDRPHILSKPFTLSSLMQAVERIFIDPPYRSSLH